MNFFYVYVVILAVSASAYGCAEDLNFVGNRQDSRDANENDFELEIFEVPETADNTAVDPGVEMDSRMDTGTQTDPIPEIVDSGDSDLPEIDPDTRPEPPETCGPEICNGLDDDCDGVLDGSEGLTRQCGITDAGECTFGTETCTDAGAWVGCDAVVPQAEICNGLDDNCSGEVDDIAGEACFESENTCGPGTTECLAGIEICSSQYGGSDFSARMVHCGDNFTDSTNESENNRQWYRDLVDPYNAKDNLYVFAAESDYQVNVHVTEMSEPFDVFIMHLCGEDYFAGGTDSGFESHWSFDAMSGEEYYIIIDTFMRQTGAYRVNIECTP